MRRTLGTAISDEHDLILHPASDLLDALRWQRVRTCTPHDVNGWSANRKLWERYPPRNRSQVAEKLLFHSSYDINS
jgi:hypothetical protein